MKIYIRPQKGFIVRDPVTKEIIPSEGREVTSSAYWLRRASENSVEICKKPKQSTKTKGEQ